ncbi:hypothetical protein SAMN05444266_110169 [Chitinophaga jiangningensis]|uniref:Uncharacterized protein n=2 Tax=Chitinophaga jiangningensis TaxID=1419482 RepID=A0A1M7L6I3_9BACT|nr:hypothetical protein SAMN05444266_110169 [Chitinophaga jiangningensis]
MLCLLCPLPLWAQQIDLEHIGDFFGKGQPLKVYGGISANTIYHAGGMENGRQPFTWNLNGTLGLNLFGKISLPFSFNLTNAGANYSYPVMPNRLSLHPAYKGVTAHIGDVSMSFSPYTLNGYQFSGAGVDVATQKDWQISAMYGRMQKPVSWDSLNPTNQPSYRRMAKGLNLQLRKEKYAIGMIIFHAADDPESLPLHLDSLNIYPRSNLVISWNGMVRPAKGLELSAEYANSAMKLDNRDHSVAPNYRWNLLKYLMHQANNTTFYKAFNAKLNYSIHKGTVGVGYERIDPGYQTLGAYYFNNDLENITFNVSHPLLNNKATIAVNVGFQRDDLDKTKSGTTSRMVGMMNLNYMPSDKFNSTLTYSNFQSYMHIKPQFDYINQTSPFQNLDTLNFKQISQNAAWNLNYSIRNNKLRNHNINLNLNFQDAADLQDGVLRKGNGSQFYYASTAYSLLFVKQQLNLVAAFNLSYNTIGRNEFLTMGPTLAANTRLLNKKASAGFTTSYNASNSGEGAQGQVLNLRLNCSYQLLKKHNLTLSAIRQTRWMPARPALNDLTATAGYNYNF